MTDQQFLADIAQSFSMDTIGKEFFQSLTAYLSRTLQVEYVFIGELLNGDQLVSSLVFFAHGKEAPGLQYPLAGSLCEQVVRSGDFCAFPNKVQQQFPQNKALKQYDVDSYVAVPLKASTGKVLGVLYLMDKHPVEDLEKVKLLLSIMAKRASLELEREQQERTLQAKNKDLERLNQQLIQTQQALKMANGGLEEQVAHRTTELQHRKKELHDSLQKVLALNQTLSQRELLLSSIVKGTSVGIATTDVSGHFTYANEGYQKLVGRPLEQLQQLTLMEITHPDDLPDNLQLLEKLVQQNVWFELEKRYVKPDGSFVWVLMNVSLLEQPEGGASQTMAVCQDITQRKQIESKLAENELQLRLLTDALPVLISYVDQDQYYRFVNQTYEQWFGEPSWEIIGKTVEQVVGAIAYTQILPKVEAVLSGQEQRFERLVDYRKIGTRFVEARYIPHWQKGQVVGFYALVTDITLYKQTQQALEKAISEAQQANQQLSSINADLDNFVYMASHDLRAPINNIDGLLKILSKRLHKLGGLTQETDSIITSLQASVSRFKETLTSLSQVIKLDQLIDRQLESIQPEEVVQDLILDLQPQIIESGATIDYHFEQCSLLLFSRKNLRSILYNLLSNAIKYRSTERKPFIHLNCQLSDEYVVMSVQDNGLGMSEAGKADIFSLFKRLHSHVEGTGIGLYMVKKMVENAGGKIEVDSQLGVGSTFRLYFKR
ncbi:PAS domain S-box protein [Rhodocytophaga aerolata]|uniref:histidine kinase n=1 Tax=Rhodocytophaga aerolata TaxID=455078 RepID=A0ABT8RFD1_9BACT|nr:PAS domain S-box protein [Rhodocytophaga aerolata]MDO1449485.1 PAS domain S-box protein [Rhodocytophaga aerolata]